MDYQNGAQSINKIHLVKYSIILGEISGFIIVLQNVDKKYFYKCFNLH